MDYLDDLGYNPDSKMSRVIEDLLAQSYRDSLEIFLDPRTYEAQSSPSQAVPSTSAPSTLSVSLPSEPEQSVQSDPVLVSEKPKILVDPTTGKRLSRAEREAYETKLYQEQKQTANNDLIRNVLLGAGALGLGAVLGRKQLARGAELAKDYHVANEVGQNYQNLTDYMKRRPSILDPRFWAATLADPAARAEQQVRLKEIYSSPLKTAGAMGYRLGLDVVTDGTRSLNWRYNHPLSITSSAVSKVVDPLQALTPSQKSALAFAVGVPAVAASGAFDVTNPAELFRPAGYKQINPNPDDPRESTEPANDLFQRFFMGRTGRPLKYSEAKKDIPDLTPERYKEYLRYTYQDKGLLDLGMIKGTGENLQGVPEVRMLGYPVTIPMVTMAALGAAGAGLATGISENQYKNQMADLVREKMDIQPTKQGGYSYVPYKKEVVINPTTGKVETTGNYVPAKSRKIVDSAADLPNPRTPQNILQYTGPKTNSMRNKQLLMGLGGVGLGVTAGYFLGNYINQAIANTRNNPDALMSTKEYGIS